VSLDEETVEHPPANRGAAAECGQELPPPPPLGSLAFGIPYLRIE